MLASIKAGDNVVLHERGNVRVCVVEDVTPAGSIRVEGCLYNPKTGRLKTSDPYATNRISVVS